MGRCPACATATSADDRFCEACGHNLSSRHRRGVRWLSSTSDAGACVELSLGAVAGVTHQGWRRRRNEDAVAVGHTDTATAAVVCDGVSSSSRPDTAARAAVDAGIRALLRALTDKMSPAVATKSAAKAAVSAVADLSQPDTWHNPPSCTYVSVVITADEVTVGWIGDSRAYWLAAPQTAESSCLTVDDTLAGQLREAGVSVDVKADSPATALIRWVGADAGDIEPYITTFDPPGHGRVLLCTDGLSRYVSAADDLAAAAAADPPEVAARRLTQMALDAGGQDNITVVVAPFPPAGGSGSPWAQV